MIDVFRYKDGVGPNRRLLYMATAALLILAPAVALVAALRADPEPEPSAAATASPAAPDIDPCLIGTWLETSNVQDLALADGDTVRLTGSGATVKFGADGTAVSDFGSGLIRSGTYKGKPLEILAAGSITFRYRAREGIIRYTQESASGTVTLKLDGVQVTTAPLSGSTEPERYICTANSLRQNTGSYTIELVRTG